MQASFRYQLGDMQGIFASLEGSFVLASAKSTDALLLTVTSNGASILRLDMLLRDPQAEVRADLGSNSQGPRRTFAADLISKCC